MENILAIFYKVISNISSLIVPAGTVTSLTSPIFLFINPKPIGDLKDIFPKDKEHLRWDALRANPAQAMFDIFKNEVFDFIKNLSESEDELDEELLAF